MKSPTIPAWFEGYHDLYSNEIHKAKALKKRIMKWRIKKRKNTRLLAAIIMAVKNQKPDESCSSLKAAQPLLPAAPRADDIFDTAVPAALMVLIEKRRSAFAKPFNEMQVVCSV